MRWRRRRCPTRSKIARARTRTKRASPSQTRVDRCPPGNKCAATDSHPPVRDHHDADVAHCRRQNRITMPPRAQRVHDVVAASGGTFSRSPAARRFSMVRRRGTCSRFRRLPTAASVAEDCAMTGKSGCSATRRADASATTPSRAGPTGARHLGVRSSPATSRAISTSSGNPSASDSVA